MDNDLINGIKTGDVAKSNNTFNSIMADKINNALDAKKQEIAGKLYGANDTEQTSEPDADI